MTDEVANVAKAEAKHIYHTWREVTSLKSFFSQQGEVKELFQYILRYTPQTIELETRYLTFIN